MRQNNHNILIIGASGYIGSNLFHYLKKKKYNVYGSYFKNKKKGLLLFDVKKKIKNFLRTKKNLRYIVLAHAINANLDKTKKKLKNSYFVNFERTKEIINYCSENGIIPVYISSDAVFDGQKGNYKENDLKKPINNYGKIKDKVEKYILKKNQKYLIVRMSKVFGLDLSDDTLMTQLLKKMKSSKKIFCAYDQKFSPIYVDDMTCYIEKLLKKNCQGIFHISSIKEVDILSLAKKIKVFFNINNVELVPKKINSFAVIERRPLCNTLSTNKFRRIGNTKNFKLEYFFKKIKENKKNKHYFNY